MVTVGVALRGDYYGELCVSTRISGWNYVCRASAVEMRRQTAEGMGGEREEKRESGTRERFAGKKQTFDRWPSKKVGVLNGKECISLRGGTRDIKCVLKGFAFALHKRMIITHGR